MAVLIYGDVMAVDENNKMINRMRTGDWQLTDLMEFKIINQPAVFINRPALAESGYLGYKLPLPDGSSLVAADSFTGQNGACA